MGPAEEREVLTQAVASVRQETGLAITLVAYEPKAPGQPDAFLTVEMPDGSTVRFAAEVKRRLTGANLGQAVDQVRRLPAPAFLVAPYVNDPAGERLKELDIPYFDTAGNIYLKLLQLYVHVKGRKPAVVPTLKPGAAFQPTGLRIIFALLCLPDLINAPYRDVAHAAGVALGTVGKTFPILAEIGYVVDRGRKGRVLVNEKRLLVRWVQGYADLLRPKLIIGRFAPTKDDWTYTGEPTRRNVFVGGEPAAARLTGHLKPEIHTFYLKGGLKEFLVTNRMKKDPEGPVECLEKFWNFDYPWNHPHLAPPLLIYADLLTAGDTRTIETAGLIYDQQLAGRFGTV